MRKLLKAIPVLIPMMICVILSGGQVRAEEIVEELPEEQIEVEETKEEIEIEEDVDNISAGRTVPYYNINTNGGKWTGTYYYLSNGKKVTDSFFCDGTYTYYLQYDGSPMKNRLTYHPDGVHIIYFDKDGHELFDQFQYCKDVKYTCYFNTYGYAYFDVTTFYNGKPYYLDSTGRMKQNEWFAFSNGVDLGYATADGSLKYSGFDTDPYGRTVYYNWNGVVAKGWINDGTMYYDMDLNDGHLLWKIKCSESTTITSGATAPEPTYMGSVLNSAKVAGILNSATLRPMATGDSTIDNRVNYILSQVTTSNMSTYDKTMAIYNWLLASNTYGSSAWYSSSYKSYYDSRIIGGAYSTLFNGTGTCFNYASGFTVLARAIGLDAYIVDGYFINRGGKRVGHTWANVIIEGEVYIFDPQIDDNGNFIPYSFFCKTDSEAKGRYEYDDRVGKMMSFGYFKK